MRLLADRASVTTDCHPSTPSLADPSPSAPRLPASPSWIRPWGPGLRGPRPPAFPLPPSAAVAAQAAAEAAASHAAWERQEALLAGDELAGEPEAAEEEFTVDPARAGKLLVSGGIAGAVSRTATAPIDRLKMLLQVEEGRRPMTMREGFRRMAAEGSVTAFFRGNGTNVLKIAPESAMKLTLNDVLKRVVCSDPDEITPGQRMAAGALAGGTAQALIYPLELVRTRLAVCPGGTYGGIIDCATKVMRQEGVRAFYRGIVPSMIGILPYAGVDITTFELLKERLIEQVCVCV